mgnify:CR=1 FL=1
MAGDVKFIRVHGRVVPIKGKGSAPKGVSKRYGVKTQKPKSVSLGEKKGAAIGAAIGAGVALKRFKSKTATGVSLLAPFIGAVIGTGIGATKFYKHAKGHSDKQMAEYAARDGMSASEKRMLKKKKKK